jgi:CheY-like chemotaxis protein
MTHSPQIVPLRPKALAPQSSWNRSVLLVDDDSYNSVVAEMLLECLGYTVTCVANARQALQVIDDGKPVDLVLANVALPGKMNGVELAKSVRARTPDMPVVLTSTDTETSGQGFPILARPYAAQTLESTLRGALAQD